MLRFPHNKLSGLQPMGHQEQEETLAEELLDGGMITTTDPADIGNDRLTLAKNCVFRDNKCAVRPGNVLYPGVKPDASPVINIVPFAKFGELIRLVRITTTGIRYRDESTLLWTNIAGAGAQLYGAIQFRPSIATAQDRFFFTGVTGIQEVNFTTNTISALGNVTVPSVIVNFNNRIVAAGFISNPDVVEWSGNLNYGVWNPAVDQSAGFTPLLSSKANNRDPIRAMFVIAERLYLLRENSIWVADTQPSATNPFKFNELKSNIPGCNCPYTAVAIPNGFMWYNKDTNMVYEYKPLEMIDPVPVSLNVTKSIKETITNWFDVNFENDVHASYDALNDEYSLAILDFESSMTSVFVYNRRNQKHPWALHIYDFEIITIVEGTFIAGLGVFPSRQRLMGHNNGTMWMERDTINTDSTETDPNHPVQTELYSKLFKIPRKGMYIKSIRIDYVPRNDTHGSVNFAYTKDGHSYTSNGFIGFNPLGDGSNTNERKSHVFKLNKECDLFGWRLISVEGLYEILGYEIVVTIAQADTRTR